MNVIDYWKLDEVEFNDMFKNCTSLTEIPNLGQVKEPDPTADTVIPVTLGEMTIEQLLKARLSGGKSTVNLVDTWIRMTYDEKEYPELFL